MRCSAENIVVSLATAAMLACGAPQAAQQEARLETAEAPHPAVASAGCTQEDAPALIIRLTLAPGRMLWIEIAGLAGQSNLAHRYTLSPLRRDVAATRERLARAWIAVGKQHPDWLSGQVSIRSARPGVGASGDYQVRTQRGQTLAGRFQATWEESRADCG